ncbi:MAG TPA: 2-isopropylmalate synthase [Desulfurococcales archaeon]|nr:2-isopropylmalate synthase [Desulfurococcales archaeon]
MEDSWVFHRDVFRYPSLPLVKLHRVCIDGLHIIDTTLRDGQQGWRPLSVDEAVNIYTLLHELNGESSVIRSCEFFLYTARDREAFRRVRELGYEYPKPVSWLRATVSDLKLAIDMGVEETVLLTSISDYHIRYKLRLDKGRVLEKYLTVVEEALKNGITVRCSLEDATRADLYGTLVPFVKSLMKLSEKYDIPVKIKICDTLGVGLPYPEIPPPRGIPQLIRVVREATSIPSEWISFHGHNDFHMVVANTLAAWLNGASGAEATLLGIGERAGNCPLEAMLLFYVQLSGSTNGLNLKVLRKVKEYFTSIGYSIPEFQPILGDNAYRTKAGIHVDGLLKNPEVYLPFDPESVLGIPASIMVNVYSGKAGVVYWLKSMFKLDSTDNLKSDKRVAKIYDEIVKMYSNGRTTPVSDYEMLQLVKKYMPDIIERYGGRLPHWLKRYL